MQPATTSSMAAPPSLALRVGRDTSGSDELSDLRAVLDRVSHGSRQDPGVWLAVVAVSRR